MITGTPVTVTVYCDGCGRGHTVRARDIESLKYTRCTFCGHLGWHSADQPDGRFPYEVNFNDRRFLRSLKIEAE